LWGALLAFMAMRGIAQAIWYPKLESKLSPAVSPAGLA